MSGEAVGERRWDALVIGGGIAGLTAAWDLVRAGLRPLLIEARGYTGGLVAAGSIGGARMDLGAEGFVVRGQAATSMLAELGCVPPPRTAGPDSFCRPSHRAPAASRPSGGCTGSPTTPTWGFRRTHWLPTSSPSSGRRRRAGPRRTPTCPAPWAPGPEDPATWPHSSPRDGGRRPGAPRATDRRGHPLGRPGGLAADVVMPGLRRATAELGSLSAAVAAVLERRRARQDGVAAGAWTQPSRAGCSGSLTRCARPSRPAAGACAPHRRPVAAAGRHRGQRGRGDTGRLAGGNRPDASRTDAVG